jgi:hypothetical protein
MKKEINDKLGIAVSGVGGLMGIIGHFIIFQNWYFRGMAAESAEEGCETLLKYLHPALTDLGILAGVLFLVAAFGFFLKQQWAWVLSVLAIVFALQSTWFINVPFMAADLPPVYFTIFFPYLILYFVLLRGVGKEPWNKTLVALLAGLTFILTFMNGVSSLSRIITIGAPIFIMTQRLHWIAMVGCGVITVGIILKPRQWMWVTGVVACTLELVIGIPLALETMRELGRFSLFSLAPIGCLIFLVVLLWPGVWQGIDGIDQKVVPDGTPEPA